MLFNISHVLYLVGTQCQTTVLQLHSDGTDGEKLGDFPFERVIYKRAGARNPYQDFIF